MEVCSLASKQFLTDPWNIKNTIQKSQQRRRPRDHVKPTDNGKGTPNPKITPVWFSQKNHTVCVYVLVFAHCPNYHSKEFIALTDTFQKLKNFLTNAACMQNLCINSNFSDLMVGFQLVRYFNMKLFQRMRSEGFPFFWGLEVCSQDLASPFATIHNRPRHHRSWVEEVFVCVAIQL